MTKPKPYKSILLAIALLLPTAFVAMSVSSRAFSQEDDDYLKELDAEAKSSASLSKKKSQPAAAGTSSDSPESATKSEMEEIQNFEKLLQFERPSTHRFFTRLSHKEKLDVIKDYNNHKTLTHSSKLIFDLYFKRN